MATNSPLDEIKEGLTCSICLSLFKKPKALPCLHTFCEHCISDHIKTTKDNGNIRCPMCNEVTSVPQSGVSGFKDNFFINNMVDCFPPEGDAMCDLCALASQQEIAVSKCIQCLDNLCKSCAEGHTKTRMTMNHTVVNLDQVKNGVYFEQMRSSHKQKCSTHPDKKLEMFCEQCETPVCVLCKAFEHDSHKVVHPKCAYQDIDKQLTDLTMAVKQKVNFIDSCILKIAKYRTSSKENTKRLSSVISKRFDAAHLSLDKMEERLLSNLDKRSRNSLEQLDATFRHAGQHRKKVSSGLQCAEALRKSMDMIDILQQHKELISRLTQINIQDFSCQLSEKSYTLTPANFVDALPVLTLNVNSKDTKLEYKDSIKKASNPKENKTLDVQEQTPSDGECEKNQAREAELPGIKVHPLDDCVATKPKILRRAKLVKSFKVDGAIDPECCDIHFDPLLGLYFISDRANSRVHVFEKSGIIQSSIPNISYPLGVDSYEEGQVMVAANVPGFLIYDSHLKKLKTLKVTGFFGGVAYNKINKQIISAGGDALTILNDDGVTQQKINKKTLGISQFSPFYVALSHSGRIITTSGCSSSLYILNATGTSVVKTYHTTGNTTRFEFPSGVCCDKWDNILVADSPLIGFGSIHVVSMAGQHIGIPVDKGDGLRMPRGLTLSGEGEVSVVEYRGLVKVYKYLDI